MHPGINAHRALRCNSLPAISHIRHKPSAIAIQAVQERSFPTRQEEAGILARSFALSQGCSRADPSWNTVGSYAEEFTVVHEADPGV